MKENEELKKDDDTLDQIKHITIKRKDSANNKKYSGNKHDKKDDKKISRTGKSVGRRAKDPEKRKDDPNKKKLTKKQKIIITLSVIGGVLLLLGIVFGVYVYKAGGNVVQAVLDVATDVVGDKDPIFVLLLGISEDISNPLTDTIILGGYNPDTQKAFMLSIPRDTFVGKSEATAGGYDKINALYQKGVDKTVAAVEGLTGIKIDYYAVVRNTVLPDIVNAIGEVEFNVPIDMDYDDPTQDLHIHLKAGTQMIDGNEAEQLLRFRHNNDGSSYPASYGDNDYGRMRTQREFIRAVAGQLASGESLTKLNKIATAVFKNLETNMPLTKALGYVPHALKFDAASIRTEQLPGVSDKLNSLWFYKASNKKTKVLVEELIAFLDMEEKYVDENYTGKITIITSEKVHTESTHTHSFDIIVEEIVPTCQNDGKEVRKCSVEGCEETDSTLFEKVKCTYKNGYCIWCEAEDPEYDFTNTNTTNTVSNTVGNNTSGNNNIVEHVCNSDKIIESTVSTCQKQGRKVTVCSICDGNKQQTDLPLAGHSFENDKPTCTTPNCSEANPNYVSQENPAPNPNPNPDPQPNPEQNQPETPVPETPSVDEQNPSGDSANAGGQVTPGVAVNPSEINPTV